RCLGRRQPDPAQQDAAFRQPAPARDHRKELVDPRGAAAAEHAAKGIENIAAGGFDGARGQIRVAGAANVLGERPSGIFGHHLLPPAPMFRYYLFDPNVWTMEGRTPCSGFIMLPAPVHSRRTSRLRRPVRLARRFWLICFLSASGAPSASWSSRMGG